jgi:hypothetical protein
VSFLGGFKPSLQGVGNAINIPDKRLLFCGDLQRLDSDLKLVGRDGQSFSIPSYFADAERRPLISPEGAALSGNVVGLLARRLGSGSLPLDSNAQACGLPIGAVQIVHNAGFVRNSIVGPFSIGSPIFRDDIIHTAEGEVGVALADQTVFVLQKGSRIAIEKFQFDEKLGEHFSVFTLISGSAAFVPGRIANAGNMQIVTPVAIFAIRGETGKGVLKVSFDAREPRAIPQSQITIFPNSDGPPGKVDVFSLEGGLVGSLTTNVIKSARLIVEAHKILNQRKVQTEIDYVGQSAAPGTAGQTNSSGPSVNRKDFYLDAVDRFIAQYLSEEQASEPAQGSEPEREPSLEQAVEPELTPELRQASEPAQGSEPSLEQAVEPELTPELRQASEPAQGSEPEPEPSLVSGTSQRDRTDP